MTSTTKSCSTRKLFLATMIVLTILAFAPKFSVRGASSTIQYNVENAFPNRTIDKNNNLYFCAFDGRIYSLVHVPNIGNVTQQPSGNTVPPNTIVQITATVTDSESPIKRVALNYTVNNFVWTAVPMNNTGGGLYTGGIPGYPNGTNVTYSITAKDNANNSIDTTELGYTFQYRAIPEFESPFALLLLLTTILAAAFLKRFIEKRTMTQAKTNGNADWLLPKTANIERAG